MAANELEHARLGLRIAEKDLAAAQHAAHTAEHDVESARAALARIREGGDEPFAVTSPVAGRVFRVLEESAGVVAAGTALLELADPQDLEVVVDVLTPDARTKDAPRPPNDQARGLERPRPSSYFV